MIGKVNLSLFIYPPKWKSVKFNKKEQIKLYKIHALNIIRRQNAMNFSVSRKVNIKSQQRVFSLLKQAFVENKGNSEKLLGKLGLL